MNHAQDSQPRPGRSRLLLGLLYVCALGSVAAGGALVSAMGGELPTYGPTDQEHSRWAWGNGLSLVGTVLTLLSAALVVVCRRRVGLRRSSAVGTAIVGLFGAGLLYIVAWGAFMA